MGEEEEEEEVSEGDGERRKRCCYVVYGKPGTNNSIYHDTAK